MRLFDFFKSLIGESEQSVDELQGFLLKPDSSGLNVVLPMSEFCALQEGNGNTLQKVQLICLNMLAEQGLAEPCANGFHILAADIAGLDDEQAEILRLPARFSGSFSTNIRGRTGNSNFRVSIAACMPEGSAPLQRKGPFLYLGESECYRLTPSELMGLMAQEEHEGLPPEKRGEQRNIRLMAELQTAARSGMRIDLSHFDHLDVVVPENIGVIATRMFDGSLQLCPSLGDGSTPEQLQKRWAQLEQSDNGGVLRIDNRVVLLDDQRMAGVRNVLANKRIPASKVSEFIRTPTAFLDAALVNLDVGFSVRVAGIGKVQHMDFGALDSNKNDWFALEHHDPAILGPTSLANLLVSDEDLERFTALFEEAVSQNADTLAFNGHVIDISNPEHIASAVAEIKTQGFTTEDTTASPPDDSSVDEPPAEKVAIILKEAEQINAGLLNKVNSTGLPSQPDWSLYARQPYPHQREGILWMLKMLEVASTEKRDDLYRLQGALLADDMGLGKTYMTLVAVGEYLRQQKTIGKPEKPILVVAPLSLLENWEDEVSKTFEQVPFRDIVVLQSGRDLSKYRIKGAERESVQLTTQAENGMLDENCIRYALNIGPEAGAQRLDMDRRLVLTTYQTLRDYQFSLCRIDWGMVIFDEAQNIKNPNALQTRAAKGLKADFKLLATGTPVENSLGDFWCLMDTAQPGLLGNWQHYRDTWIKPIIHAEGEERDRIRGELGLQLRQAVGPFMLRRIKEDQLQGLPQKHICSGVESSGNGVQTYQAQLAATMHGKQLQAYDDVLNSYRERQQQGDSMQGAALAALNRLRTLSLHPRLDDESNLYCNDSRQARQLMQESGKLGVVLQLLDQIRHKQEKVILFMMTKRLQRLLKYWLEIIYGLDIAIINGDTKAVAKKSDELTSKSLITTFEAKVVFNIIIMSPVAAGVGLTVIGANHVVHIERHWNPAKEAQASDRVYRIGQKKDVFIHLPTVKHPQFDSFDVHLDRLLQGKLILKDAVITPEAISESDIMQSLGL